MKKQKRAFTLAELLVSMMIIAILSVLMVPVIMNNQKKILETQTAHFYSMMSNAVKQYMVNNDTENLNSTRLYFNDDENAYVDADAYLAARNRAYAEVDKFIKEYLKVRKICEELWDDNNTENECFSTTVTTLSENVYNMGHIARKGYVLDNGVALSMIPLSGMPGEIQFDVNGKKGPNTPGRDIWRIHLYRDGVLSEGLHGIELANKNASDTDIERWKRNEAGVDETNFCESSYGNRCFARFEYNGFKFDY